MHNIPILVIGGLGLTFFIMYIRRFNRCITNSQNATSLNAGWRTQALIVYTTMSIH